MPCQGVTGVSSSSSKFKFPKKYETKATTAKTANKTTIPISALVTLPLAASTEPLSPPEPIQEIAPPINIKTNITDPATSANEITFPKKVSKNAVPVVFAKFPSVGLVIIEF